VSSKPEGTAIQKCKRIFWAREASSSTGGSEERMRRLITLISASRNHTIVIRRDLPRTEDVSSGARPHRTKRRRVLIAVSRSPVAGTAAKRTRVFSQAACCCGCGSVLTARAQAKPSLFLPPSASFL